MTKHEDRLRFDFTGTDRQARGAINCTRVGLESGILSAVLPMLCYDVSWSPGGVMPRIEIVSEEGTINNARHPAAVSMATVSAIFATSHVTSGTIAKMLACSDLRQEIQANWAPAWQGLTMAGHYADGRAFTAVLLDETGGAGGRSWKDGIDTGGLPGTPAMAIANVETYEKEYPILYVYRREAPDTGGQGRYRGGVGTEGMLIAHRNKGPIDVTGITHGVSQPEAQGLYGGYPSSVQVKLLLRDSDIRRQFQDGRIPVTVESVHAEKVEVMAAKQRLLVNPDDAIVVVCAGGGGYGDPLGRDPELVLRDVESGLVTDSAAKGIYGVALSAGDGRLAVDDAATAGLREALRRRRLEEGVPASKSVVRFAQVSPGAARATVKRRIGDALDLVGIDGRDHYACQRCGRILVGAADDPKRGTLAREINPESLSQWNRCGDAAGIVVREFCCPGCAHMIAVEVRKAGDPVLYDTELH